MDQRQGRAAVRGEEPDGKRWRRPGDEPRGVEEGDDDGGPPGRHGVARGGRLPRNR